MADDLSRGLAPLPKLTEAQLQALNDPTVGPEVWHRAHAQPVSQPYTGPSRIRWQSDPDGPLFS